MSDIQLPRIICGGLIGISALAIVAACLCMYFANSQITPSTLIVSTVAGLIMISSNVVSGLLGYVTATVTQKEPKP